VLAVLLHEFLHFPILLSAMACRVVHWATCAFVITVRRLIGALVTSGTSTPTHRGSSYDGGSSSQRLVVASDLLLVVVLVFAATSLGGSTHIGLATFPRLWGRWGVPGTALCGPGTLVHQEDELNDILDVMHGEILQHIPIPHTLAKCNYNRSIGDMRNSVVNLGKPLNEGA
jgi:hypothetical protein